MGKQVFLMCKFDGCISVVNLTENYTYDQLVYKIRSRWSDLADVSFSLSYSLLGLDNIFLENDEDLGNLLFLAETENIKRVEVFVNTTGKNVKDSGGAVIIDEDGQNNVGSSYDDGENVKDSSGAVIIDEDNDQMNAGSYYDDGKNVKDSSVTVVTDEDNDRMNVRSYFNDEPDRLSEYSSHQETQLLTACWSELIREVGQVFEGGATQLRNDLSKYSIEVGFEYILEKNDGTRINAICLHRAEKRCMWRLDARKELSNGYFYIKKLDNGHTCGDTVRKLKNKRMSSDIVASEILDEVRDNPRISPVNVVKRFKTAYGLDITYDLAWIGVQKARKLV